MYIVPLAFGDHVDTVFPNFMPLAGRVFQPLCALHHARLRRRVFSLEPSILAANIIISDHEISRQLAIRYVLAPIVISRPTGPLR